MATSKLTFELGVDDLDRHPTSADAAHLIASVLPLSAGAGAAAAGVDQTRSLSPSHANVRSQKKPPAERRRSRPAGSRPLWPFEMAFRLSETGHRVNSIEQLCPPIL
jgi:hypothetical protein